MCMSVGVCFNLLVHHFLIFLTYFSERTLQCGLIIEPKEAVQLVRVQLIP